MNEQPSKSLDLLGIKPVAESVNKVTCGSIDGASAFLSRICLPAAEEFGLLLRDKVRYWRAQNIASMTKSADERFHKLAIPDTSHAHPRVVAKILEEGSWNDDAGIREMWAGLLASSCTSDGQDDSNLLFIRLLAQLSRIQARLLNYGCEMAGKQVSKAGLLMPKELQVSLVQLRAITHEDDIHRLDREMDHLRSLELIQGGFPYPSASTDADITPTALALHMYARCQGFIGSPVEFFGANLNLTPNAKPDETNARP